MNSQTLPSFWKLYRKLPSSVRRAARDAFAKFTDDPNHPVCVPERLFNDPQYWSVRITRNCRAVGILEGDTVTWVWIGLSDEFDQQHVSR